MDPRYQKTFDQITMPEDKAQAMRRRLAAQCSGSTTKQEEIPRKKTKTFRRSRLIAVAVAAALVLSLGTAGATGALKSVQEAFGGMFGSSPTQTAIVEEMGKAVGTSATAGGLTITVDAILGDQANYVIVYSITPEEGITLPTPKWKYGTKDENDTFLTYTLYQDGFPTMPYTFYDADPSDPSIQFIEREVYPDGIPTKTIKKTFDSLTFGDCWSEEEELIATGPWKLTFPLDYEDNSLVLATNQAISVKGETATVDSIIISPLSLTIKSSFGEVIDWEEDMLTDPFADYEDAPLGRALTSIPVTITLKDGTTVDAVRGNANSVKDKGGKTYYTRNIQFIEVIPLDTMESVTIGDTVFPVAQ